MGHSEGGRSVVACRDIILLVSTKVIWSTKPDVQLFENVRIVFSEMANQGLQDALVSKNAPLERRDLARFSIGSVIAKVGRHRFCRAGRGLMVLSFFRCRRKRRKGSSSFERFISHGFHRLSGSNQLSVAVRSK